MAEAVFPWRSGGTFELLVDGPRYFPRMLEAIADARQSLALELYLLEPGVCMDTLRIALLAAAERGVKIRCMFDDFGCAALPRHLLAQLRQAGIELRLYNPVRWLRGVRNFYRDHRKLLLLDQRVAFVGGMGVTDHFWQPQQQTNEWHEVMVQMQGPVVLDWLRLFDRQWQACELPLQWKPEQALAPIETPALPDVCAQGWGRVAYADGDQHHDMLNTLVQSLQGARRRIWFATPYFLPTWKVRRLLRKAAKRGIDVRLLLTGRHTDNPPVRYAGQRYYPQLLRSGVRIYEYQPRFLHLKMVLVDDWLTVGSCNFDHWNLRFNLDANLESLDQTLIDDAAQMFVQDFAQSLEVTSHSWRARPWRDRIKQALWGRLDRLVLNLFRHERQ